MNILPRQTMIDLISRYGDDLATDPKRCEGLLRDFCGSYKREIFVLVCALREGIVTELREAPDGTPKHELIARATQHLHEILGLERELALWGVETWVTALRLFSNASVATGRVRPAGDISGSWWNVASRIMDPAMYDTLRGSLANTIGIEANGVLREITRRQVSAWSNVPVTAARRWALYGLICSVVAIIFSGMLGWPIWAYPAVQGLIVLAVISRLSRIYSSLPQRQILLKARAALNSAEEEVNAALRSRDLVQNAIDQSQAPLIELRKHYRVRMRFYQHEVQALNERHKITVAIASQRAAKLTLSEQDELLLSERKTAQDVRDLELSKARLREARDSECKNVLDSTRRESIRVLLGQQTILNARIPGIGKKLIARLQAAGLNNANDVYGRRVDIPGIGGKKAVALSRWASQAMVAAQNVASQSLPSNIRQTISKKYEIEEQKIDQKVDMINRQHIAQLQCIVDQNSPIRMRWTQELREAETAFQHNQTALEYRHNEERRELMCEFNQKRQGIIAARRKLISEERSAVKHLNRARKKYDSFQSVVDEKHSLTFLRYLLRVFAVR